MSVQDADTRRLRVLGICSMLLYAGLAAFFWTAWSFKDHWLDQVVILVATGALVILYFSGVKFARHAAASAIVAFALAMAIVGVIMPAFDSTDVFFYMATGWQQAHYGSNPYSRLLRNVDGAFDDPMIQNAWMARNRNPWLDIPIPYGFLFALLARGLAWIGSGNFWRTLFLFKCLNLLMHAGTALFLWKAAKWLPESNGKAILYFYSWNPFVVLQYLADSHNDIIVAFLIVLAAYFLLKNRPIWSLPVLVAAGLVKYVTLVLVPFALIFLIRQKGWRESVRAILISAALLLAAAAPYAAEHASFKYHLIWVQVSDSTGSLHAFVVYSFRAFARMCPLLLGSVSTFGVVTKAGLWIVFTIFVLRQLYVSWREPDEEPLTMIQRWTSIMFVLIFVASSQFFAWYLGMMFPLALLTHRKTILADCVIALSGAHMLSFTFLRRKAIGYFVFATLIPILYLMTQKWWLSARGRSPGYLNSSKAAQLNFGN
jgi:alpha-1,6-mannosyltransferase